MGSAAAASLGSACFVCRFRSPDCVFFVQKQMGLRDCFCIRPQRTNRSISHDVTRIFVLIRLWPSSFLVIRGTLRTELKTKSPLMHNTNKVRPYVNTLHTSALADYEWLKLPRETHFSFFVERPASGRVTTRRRNSSRRRSLHVIERRSPRVLRPAPAFRGTRLRRGTRSASTETLPNLSALVQSRIAI